jgi:hypothetical protein
MYPRTTPLALKHPVQRHGPRGWVQALIRAVGHTLSAFRFLWRRYDLILTCPPPKSPRAICTCMFMAVCIGMQDRGTLTDK